MATTTTESKSKNESSAGTKNAPATTTTTTAPQRTRKRQTVSSMMATPWKPEEVGDMVEGTYLGMEMAKGKGQRKPFPSYHIMKPDNVRIRVASAMLNTKLNQVPKGTYIWLTYVGPFATDNGASDDYNVEVEDGTELIDPLSTGGSMYGHAVDK